MSLLKHPVVTALLHYKWGKFGRYFYYTGLLFYLVYLILLNVYMQQTPFFYQIDWVKMISLRKGNSGELRVNIFVMVTIYVFFMPMS